MFQDNAFQQNAFQVQVEIVSMAQGGDPAPLPMFGLILQSSGASYIIQIIMNQLRSQGQA